MEQFNGFIMAIDHIRAEEKLHALSLQDFPNMKSSKRREFSDRLQMRATPKFENEKEKTHSTAEAAEQIMRLING